MFDFVPESPRLQAAAAPISAVVGICLIGVFLRTPQYAQIPDPRIIPINGLHFLALGVTALLISAYVTYTLSRRSEAASAGAVDSEEHSRSTAIENLRRRYATGDISHTEFEHRLERLLETEDISHISQSKSLLRTDEEASRLDTDSASSSEVTEEQSY
jgi:Predicted membrane protein (DUF2078).